MNGSKTSLLSTFKTTTDSNWQLGEVLVQAGFVTHEQILEITSSSKASAARLGQLLVISGRISHNELHYAIETQGLLRDRVVAKQAAIDALRMTRSKQVTLQEALAAVNARNASQADGETCRLGELLVIAGLITEQELQDAQDKTLSTGLPLGRILTLNGLVDETQLTAALNMQVLVRHGRLTRADAVAQLQLLAVPPSFEETVETLAIEANQCAPIQEEISGTTVFYLEEKHDKSEELLIQLLSAVGLVSDQTLELARTRAKSEAKSLNGVLREQGFIDEQTFVAAEEMCALIAANKLEMQAAISSLTQICRQNHSRLLAASMLPAGTDNGVKEPEQTPKASSIDITDFLVLTKKLTDRDARTIREVCDGNVDLNKLMHVDGLTYRDLQVAGVCFDCYKAGSANLDQAIYAHDFCLRAMNEGQIPFLEAADKLAFQTGIWAIYDQLSGI